MSALEKSNVYDDVVFFTENLSLLKSIYPLNGGRFVGRNEENCRNIWQNKNFVIRFSGDMKFKVDKSVTEKMLRQAGETTYFGEHSQSFKAKNGRKGAMYAEPVEWVSPAGEKLFGNVVINAEFTWEQFGENCYKET